MRVLITTDSFPPGCGGSGWSTYELARGLKASGHEVTVVHLRPGQRGSRGRIYEGIDVEEQGLLAPPLPVLRNYFKNERSYERLVPLLRKVIRRGGFDIVHAQHVLSAPPSIAAARQAGVPVVCTVRDYWPVCYWSDLIHDPTSSTLCPGCEHGMMRRCIRPRAGVAWPLALALVPYMAANLRRKRLALAQANAVVAVSSMLAHDLLARAPELAATRMETIPNPLDLEAVTKAAGTAHPLDDRPYAVYAGKLARNKGVSMLIPAIERAGLPWPLVVIGDGPEREAVRAAAERSGRDVRMLGWLERSETLRWMAHSRLVVFPSYGPESLSRVLLESSALGRPIAAVDTGGTRDIIVDGDTGLLARTPADLAAAIRRIVAEPEVAERLGAQAATRVRERFEATRVVARIAALYGDLASDAGRRRDRVRSTSPGAGPEASASHG